MHIKSTFPLSYSMAKSGLPLIAATLFDKNICLLIDTGSTMNLLDKKVHEYFKDKISVISSSELIGIDGIKQSAERVNLSFTFEDTEYNTHFNLFDTTLAFNQVEKDSDIQIHGILGNEFLVENEWILDFEKLAVYSNK